MTRLLDLPSGQKPKGLTMAFVATFATLVLLSVQVFLLSTLPVVAQSTLDVCLGCTYETIQDAIDAADPEDTIRVAQGVYTENLVITKGIILEGGYEASGWTRDIELYETTIDGNRSDSVISVTSVSTVTIDGFTIRGGYAERGGGIYLDGASVTIRNNSIEDNAASPPQVPVEINEPLRAGDKRVTGIADPREAEQVEIWDWTAATHIGTATVWSYGYFSVLISPPLTAGHSIRAIASYGYDEAVVQAGASAEPAGADIHEAGGERELTVEQGDSAWGPGGHRDPGWETREPLHSGQMATLGADIASTRGGGIYVLDSVVVITGNLVFSNTARDFGGGIYVENSTVTIGGNDVISNSSGTAPPVSRDEGYGGGIAILPGSEFTMTDNLLAENTVLHGGGGVYVTDSVGSMVGNEIIGNGLGEESYYGCGGGIYVGNSSPLVQGNDILSNTLGTHELPAMCCAYGGAICLVASSSVIADNDIKGNTVVVYPYCALDPYVIGQGGGIHVQQIQEASCLWRMGVETGSWPIIADNRIVGNSVEQHPSGEAGAGGGISSFKTSVTIVGNEVVGNWTQYDAGGITVASAQGLEDAVTVVISNNVVMSNTAVSGYGNGFAGGISLGPVSSTIKNNLVAGNAGDAAGGLCLIETHALVEGNDIVGNMSTLGVGGVLWFDMSPLDGDGDITILDNAIVENVGPFSGGIALGKGSFIVRHNQIMSNTGGECGGGIAAGGMYGNAVSVTITMDSNEIIANHASDSGGGIWFRSDTSFTLTNNIIAGNSAASHGGGVYISDSEGRIINNTIAENDEGAGEGIYLAGSSAPTITNNIIVTHTHGIYEEGSGLPTVNYNDVWGNSVGDYWGLTPGAGNVSADPQFVDPVAWDYHLRAGSPAINAGHPDDSIAPPYDFDGDSRPFGGRVDMGADEASFEFSLVKADEPDPVSPGGLLTYTIVVTNVSDQIMSGVLITDRVPVNTSFSWASDGGQETGGVVSWTVSSVATGESVTRTMVVTVDEGLSNGTVIGNDGYGVRSEETPAPIMGSPVTTLVGFPVLTIGKGAEPDPVTAGAELTYTLVVTNSGGLVATGVVISDMVPLNTTFMWAGDGGQLVGDEVVWTDVTVGAGESAEVTWGVTVTESLYVEEIINESYGVRRADELEAVMGESVHTPLLRYEWWLPLAMKNEFERPK